MTADVGVVIVAGGKGTRAGGDELKQFRWVAGKPMLLHSIQKFQARNDVAMVVVVLPFEHVGDPPAWLFQSDTERMLLSVGGRERSDSVRNGLEDIPSDVNVVVIHDAALCERLGMKVIFVAGSERAMKITEEADFVTAEALSILPE